MISIRKLAAIDLVFLGSKFIIAEFLLGVLGPAALGIFIAARSTTTSQRLLATYFILLGLNYVPLLAYALSMTRTGTARQQVADEIAEDKRRAMRRYRRGSLLLLLPLVVPVVALVQRQD